jgi:hypothetical protein
MELRSRQESSDVLDALVEASSTGRPRLAAAPLSQRRVRGVCRSPSGQVPLLVTLILGKLGSEMARVEVYKAYRILAYERQLSGRWLAEIRKADGSALIIAQLDGDTRREFITTSAAMFSADAAIKLAKQAIDGGGLK